MSTPYISQSQYGKNEDFNLQIARRQIQGHKSLFKFGNNPDVNGSLETIWSGSSMYVYPTSAIQMKVSSANANDTALGTGARTVSVQGLDKEYNEISETVILNGQTPVLTINTFIRVFRVFVITAGSTNTAQGIIYVGDGVVTAGVPAIVYAEIPLGENQTLMAIWTVPANYTLYVYRATFSAASNNAAQYILGKFVIKPFNSVFRNAADVTANSNIFSYDFEIPLAISEKSDVEARAIALSGTNFYVTASFEGAYIKNSTD